MADKQTRCKRCGKIVAPQEEIPICVRCRDKYLEDGARVREAIEQHGLKSHEDVAAFAGVTLDEVDVLLNDPVIMKKRVVEERPCSRCKERPAQNRSDYCLVCRMELNKAFGDAARTLAQVIEREVTKKTRKEVAAPTSVASTLDRKRGRSAISKLDPTPRNRYSQ
jgi:hypothetical protein